VTVVPDAGRRPVRCKVLIDDSMTVGDVVSEVAKVQHSANHRHQLASVYKHIFASAINNFVDKSKRGVPFPRTLSFSST
jgi:hypothetical protein